MLRMILLVLQFAAPALATEPNFPLLTGRVVDEAGLLSPAPDHHDDVDGHGAIARPAQYQGTEHVGEPVADQQSPCSTNYPNEREGAGGLT
jgi:hypothetical protein